MLRIKSLVLATSMLITHAVIAETRWDSDPSTYVSIRDIAGAGQSVVDSQGNIITGFSDPSQRYDFFLTKFDRHGNQLWNNEAVLIKERDQSYIKTWSIELGQNDEVYTAVEDISINEIQITKTNAEGDIAWQYSPTNEKQYQVLISDLSPNEHGVAFSYNYSSGRSNNPIDIGLLSHEGKLLWQVEHTPDGTNDSVLDIRSVKDGIVVLTAGYRDSDRSKVLVIQKYDFEGNRVWGDENVLLMEGEQVLPFNSPSVVGLYDDGNGGVAFAWRQVFSDHAETYFQQLNAKGEALYAGTGIRISTGFDSKYKDVSVPTLVVSQDEFIVSWAAQGGVGPYNDYAMFYQRISRDGKLLLGSEPIIVAEINDPDAEVDKGYFNGGFLSLYEETLSLAYVHSHTYTGLDQDIRLVKFTLNGEVLSDKLFVDSNDSIGRVSPNVSPFGDIITSFKKGFEVDTPTYIQSTQASGELGATSALTLSWSAKPVFIDEDNVFTNLIRFVDNSAKADANYTYSATTEVAEVSVAVTQLNSGDLSVTITPEAEFSGDVPYTITVSDANDGARTSSKNYRVTFNEVNDKPSFILTESFDIGEDEEVVVDANIKDPDTQELTIQWQQTSGQRVDFDNAVAILAFHSPVVTASEILTFALTVNDGETTLMQDVVVNVANDKIASITKDNFFVQEAKSIQINPTLSGAQFPVSASWAQLSGPDLTLSADDQLEISVTAPFIDDESFSTLSLTIVDANGEIATQTFIVNITEKDKPSSGGSTSLWLLSILSLVLVRRFSSVIKG